MIFKTSSELLLTFGLKKMWFLCFLWISVHIIIDFIKKQIGMSVFNLSRKPAFFFITLKNNHGWFSCTAPQK